jgi:formate hydrogenlyase subunit 3/multisubunit Na+/H+ antiporter MnhD subunit
MKQYEGQGNGFSSHFFFLSLLIVSMIMAVSARHAVIFLISWEIMSISSFFLVVFENDRKETYRAGIYYLIMMHVSVALLMLGFALACSRCGSFYFSDFAEMTKKDAAVSNAVFLILFAGFAIKAGLIPAHTWLPLAHPAAPTHVSGIMSGVMIKIGIYGILRTLTFAYPGSSWIAYMVLAAGLFSSLLGVLYAVAQHDMKRLLAYHSVENIGIITTGIGLGMLGVAYNNTTMSFLGFAGAILHVLNHSIFKELLFFGAGSVYTKTHTREMDSLGALAKKMPKTAFYFLTGSIAITGLPPLNGFISEFMIYLAMIEGIKMRIPALAAAGAVSMAALALTGAMALLCFTKIYSVVFLGNPRSKEAVIEPGEDKIMTAAMAPLAAMCAVIGFFPQYALKLAALPASLIINSTRMQAADTAWIYNIFEKISAGLLIMAASVIAFYFIKKFMLAKKTKKQQTWGCGYGAPDGRMQYTASSYASPLLNLSGPFIIKEVEIEKPYGLFPQKASFKSHAVDVFEAYIIKPVCSVTDRILRCFSWIQGGAMQLYIIYGIVFLTVSIIWILAAK